jgi:amino acid transporter
MKKLLVFLPFFLACCLLLVAIAWGIFGIYDLHRELVRLEHTQGASGVDYLGAYFGGFLCAGGEFLIAVAGTIFSVISRKALKNEKFQRISGVLMVVFILLIFLSLSACFLIR